MIFQIDISAIPSLFLSLGLPALFAFVVGIIIGKKLTKSVYLALFIGSAFAGIAFLVFGTQLYI